MRALGLAFGLAPSTPEGGLLQTWGGGEEKEEEELLGDTKTRLDFLEDGGEPPGERGATGAVTESRARIDSGTTVEQEARDMEEEKEPCS